MRYVNTICLFIFLQSCVASAKWKKTYITKKTAEFESKYAFGSDFQIHLSCFNVKAPWEKQTKKEVKISIRCFESGVAQIPDSVSEVNGVIDSFYNNKNKISYIQKHSLLTEHKHFI